MNALLVSRFKMKNIFNFNINILEYKATELQRKTRVAQQI